MRVGNGKGLLAVLCLALLGFATPVSAQITTGTIAGTIQDSSGGVIPGATIVLISESRGTRGVPAVTNATGDFVFPNTTPDTYTVEVTMRGFRTLRRPGVTVSGGDRVAVGALKIEPGGATETVTVTADQPVIQSNSGERSFSISAEQVANLPMAGNRNFANLVGLVPGVLPGGDSAGGTRIGGVSQNNIMMDGISAMDTGNNGQMLQMNVESIAEVKVLTQGYQAEYGRSSGLQITAVTKSGTNRFHGSVYDIEDRSKWNTNSWQNQKNSVAKPYDKRGTYGYSIGGPAGKPGGSNKLFFFYSHEYRPTKTSGSLNRFRVPTALEQAGNFSQSLDNNGQPIPQLLDPVTRAPYPGNIIPASSFYAPGLAILKRYTASNLTQAAATNYNLEIPRPEDKNLTQQPALRMDYQFSSALRITGKYSGERQRERVVIGTMPGFNDVKVPYPYISNYGITVNYTLNPTTFIEATYGSIKNELAGGGSGGILVNDSANRLNGLADLPLIYPDAGVVDPRYYQLPALERTGALYFVNGKVNLPPAFSWGNRIGAQPPNQAYPGWLNVNKTQDIAVSMTKVMGRHTFKTGAYNNHSFKAQNTGAGGGAPSFVGNLDFGNSTNNPLDTGFGYANALVGVFTGYGQGSKLIEGSMIYNNTEFYLQDNWKVNSRLTLDYGMRFTRQQPQYDQFGQMTNFFPKEWSKGSAPYLYVPGCNNGAVVCSTTGNVLNAMNPVTGAILTAPGASNTASAIGTIIPNSGNLLNGIKVAGQGIDKAGYTWPTIVYAPRVGVAYDLSGNQSMVLRGGAGLFYDRPDGNTVFSIPGNPPFSESQNLSNGQLQTLGKGLSTVGTSSLVVFQYDAKVPSSVQWNAGVQMVLPWASSLDVSYVGNYGFNRLNGLQGGNQVNLNSIDIGAAYLAANQDPTRAASATPGAAALTTTLLRPLRGFNSIGQHTTEFWDKYHSIQTSFNRRLRGGVRFGANYTLSLVLEGNTGLTRRLQHAADGSISYRADQQKYEDLFKNLNLRRHILRANVVWDMPDMATGGDAAKRAIAAVVNDWQITGILATGSASHYDLGYSYQNNGGNVNLTGSPDFGARIKYIGDAGNGCSSNLNKQFNTAALVGPDYFSDGLESGRNVMQGCADKNIDISLSRNIRLGGDRAVQLRMDAFNAFNIFVVTGRETTLQYDNPVSKTILNSQFLADGSINPARVTPQTAGFGGVTGAQAMRTVRVTARFSF